MLFTIDKCNVMRFGFSDALERYEMNGKQGLLRSARKRDLGIVAQIDLIWSKQCVKVLSCGNKILGMLRLSFVFKTKEMLVQLYTSLVRPHLECCVHAWRPHLKKDTLKMIDEFNGIHYVDKLRKIGLYTQKTARRFN